MNKFYFLILFILGLFLLAGTAFAATVCQPIYGGGQTCVTTGNILVNKTVINPATGQFVDNLGVNDPKFSPGSGITFNIAVTNIGAATILQTKVTDTLPPAVIFVSASNNGTFDQGSRTVTWIVDNLKSNETRNFTIQGRIVDANQIAQEVICDPANLVVAITNENQRSEDLARFCIQKTVVTKGGLPVFPPPKVITTPPTGPEMLPLIGLLPAGIGGWFLRRLGGKK